MKRIVIISFSVAVAAAFVVAILVRSKQGTPLEICHLSESLVISKVQAYRHNPSVSTLAAVKDAIASHREMLDRADLSRESREAMERTLYEQMFIVRGIARNDDLKL